MKYIAHRINTVDELKNVPTDVGCEIDLRPFGEKLVLQHDPFLDGDEFSSWIKEYSHGTLILNIKSERIENHVQQILKDNGVEDYFFLDSSFPMIRLLSEQGEKNSALRLSEYEGMDTLVNMQGRVSWVWVDCFTKIPCDAKVLERISGMGYETCLVSPELQGRDQDIEVYAAQIAEQGLKFDAICTKLHNIGRWKKLLG